MIPIIALGRAAFFGELVFMATTSDPPDDAANRRVKLDAIDRRFCVICATTVA